MIPESAAVDSRMSRHLLLTYDFPPIGGGIARMMGELAGRYPPGSLLVSTGRVSGAGAADSLLPNRVERLAMDSRRLRTLQGLIVWSRRARELSGAFDPSFVWCGNLKPAGFPAAWVNRRAGTPYGIFLHGTELLLLQHRIRRSPRKRIAAAFALRHAAVLVAVSDWTRNLCLDVLDEMGLGNDRIEVRTLPLGTDPEHFSPGLDAGAVRARYGLGESRWLLTVARLAAHKGIDTGIEILAALRESHPALEYVVVGHGVKQAELESLAQHRGVADRVRFLTAVPDEDLPALYNGAALYLGLSRPAELMIEGFGISLTEASACGIPVLGGRAGGIPDAVRDGETGFLVDTTDLGGLVATVRSLLADPELRARLGQAGRRAVETHYNWDRVTGDVRRIGQEFGVRVATA
jgi:phosphatidylinositol alpha-1,6-mannosyltransferase